jgi:hypothetical protein
MAEVKVPVTLSISYEAIKEMLRLPVDVDVLGILGAKDDGGVVQLIIETPPRHIKRSNLKVQYKKTGDLDMGAVFGSVEFDGFA